MPYSKPSLTHAVHQVALCFSLSGLMFWPLTVCLLLSGCGRPDDRSLDQIASSIRARSGAVQSLKEANRVREDGRGNLRAESGMYLEIAERRLVEEENYEREKVFASLAKSYQIGRANVAQVFAKLAARSK